MASDTIGGGEVSEDGAADDGSCDGDGGNGDGDRESGDAGGDDLAWGRCWITDTVTQCTGIVAAAWG